MKKIILLIILIFWLWFSSSYQVDVSNPTNDIQSENWWSIDDTSSTNYYQNLSEIINTYLWFIFGSIALWMLIYGWILLISSNGNPEDLKKANKILIWWLVWIFVSLLSYLVVKLLINLF